MKFISSDEFKQIDKKKHNTVPRLQKAAYDGAEVTGDRQITFVISSESVDRDNDRIPTKAWDFNNFMKNPVVLWSHRSDELPIGKCINRPVIQGGKVKATVEFPEEGVHPNADRIFEMCKNGFLSATSVGFSSKDWDYSTDPERGGDSWKPGIDFKQAELMEFSICSVPSNPEALIQLDFTVDHQKETDQLNKQTNAGKLNRAKRILKALELQSSGV